jgi:hypothetical protein
VLLAVQHQGQHPPQWRPPPPPPGARPPPLGGRLPPPPPPLHVMNTLANNSLMPLPMPPRGPPVMSSVPPHLRGTMPPHNSSSSSSSYEHRHHHNGNSLNNGNGRSNGRYHSPERQQPDSYVQQVSCMPNHVCSADISLPNVAFKPLQHRLAVVCSRCTAIFILT